MAGAPLVEPRRQYNDTSGTPLAGGFVYTYLAGSSTLTPTWQDYGQATLNTNPIVLSAAGHCTLFGDPAKRYKLVITDSQGVEQTHLGGDNTMVAGALAEQVQSFATSASPWTLTGNVYQVTKIFMDGRLFRLNNFSIAGNTVTPSFSLTGMTLVDIYYI